ncbi:hypothetical protein NSQ29_07220 [Paenibacillus sp. FSL F4-0236]|uniref:hypothetical protein n=1 Tax=Paenibacillus sp. FSL F4-0236 TaxID=2954731 RepID=UPI0030F6620F
MKETIKICKKGYDIVIEKGSGCIRELYDNKDANRVNLVDRNRRFGSLAATFKDKKSYHTEISHVADAKKHIVIDDQLITHSFSYLRGSCAVFTNFEYNSTLKYEFMDEFFILSIEAADTNISQFGMNLDFNFLGKLGTGYEDQVIPTSPYTSADGKASYYLMTRPNGRWVLVTSPQPLAGWRLEYSPNNFGHFILGLKMFESFDDVFVSDSGTKQKHTIALRIDFPDTYREAMSLASSALGSPVPYFPVAGGTLGTELPMTIEGVYNKIILHSPSGNSTDITEHVVEDSGGYQVSIRLCEEGFYRVEAFGNSLNSLDCVLFSFSGWNELFRKASSTIEQPYHCDENLAEGGVWCWALCEHIKRFGVDPQLADRVLEHIDHKILNLSGVSPTPGCSIVPYPHRFEGREYGPYHIFESTRIQEQFFGVSILLSAYQAFGNSSYLEYAIDTLLNLLHEHIAENGAILCYEKGREIDYTTVCAPVIAVVDMAKVLGERRDPREAVFQAAAVKIADYLLQRGFHFPTEGDQEYSQSEMEDGSISCTALSVLYVCFHIEFKHEYIRFAESILRLHDAWKMYTPDARMYQSSFRWWETIWEGDQDGPCINAGHAWTIWRGEADFYYSLLTGDMNRLLSSYNAYLTNLSKIQQDGTVYACYIPDYIPYSTEPGVLVHRYPLKPDHSLSRYVWPRAVDTWFKSSGIHSQKGKPIALNGEVTFHENCLVFMSTAPEFSYFFVGDIRGRIRLATEKRITIISQTEYLSVYQGRIEAAQGIRCEITPENKWIEIELG